MIAAERLCLGSVQWGLPYGIANRRGKPGLEEVRGIVEVARAAGVRTLDTARDYGDAERVIGELVGSDDDFEVATKLASSLGEGSLEEVVEQAIASVETSRRCLRRDRLDVLFLHRPSHRTLYSGAVWNALLELRAKRLVGQLGVSVARVEEAEPLLEDPTVDVIQVPASLLDQRLERAGFFDRAREKGKRVFIRSIFLQGAAFLDGPEIDPFLAPIASALGEIDGWCHRQGITRSNAFLHHALGLHGQLVLGFEQAAQLAELLALPPLISLEGLAAVVPLLEEEQLDPVHWLGRLG